MKAGKILLIFFLSYGNFLFSQDLIVTTEGDSIQCKIIEVNKENLQFIFNNEITLIPIQKVKHHQLNITKSNNTNASKHEYTRFNITFNGGYSYRTAKIADGLSGYYRDYVQRLKSGYHIGFDATYYFSENNGIGIKYSFFNSRNHMDNILLTFDDGTTVVTEMADNIKILFIGPYYNSRILSSDFKHCFNFNLGLGYFDYIDYATLMYNFTLKGNTFGLYAKMGYSLKIMENIALDFQINVLSGSIFEFEYSDGSTSKTISLEDDEYESLARIDFSLGLNFNF